MEPMLLMKDFIIEKWQQKSSEKIEDEEDIQGKTVVITGANSGVGKAAAVEFSKRGAIVVMACRDIEKAKVVIQEIKQKCSDATLILVELDLADMSSIRKCADDIHSKCKEIHILVNNAGCLYTSPPIQTTKNGFEMHMGINYLGHFLFTSLLLELIKNSAPSRIVFVGSSLFLLAKLDLDDIMLAKTGYFGIRNLGPYANSKLAMLYYATELAERLNGSGVTVYTLCPGYVKTDAFRNESCLNSTITKASLCLAGTSPEQSVGTLLRCAISKKIECETGKMYRFNSAWDKANRLIADFDKETIIRLWALSEQLTELNTKVPPTETTK